MLLISTIVSTKGKKMSSRINTQVNKTRYNYSYGILIISDAPNFSHLEHKGKKDSRWKRRT